MTEEATRILRNLPPNELKPLDGGRKFINNDAKTAHKNLSSSKNMDYAYRLVTKYCK